MVKKNKLSAINIILIFLGIIVSVFSVLIVSLQFMKKSIVEAQVKSVDTLATNYTSTEEEGTTNTWDISENQDGSIIGTFSEDGILNINGTGKMKSYNSTAQSMLPFGEIYKKIKEVNISEGVTNITTGIFYECINLEKATIPSTVTYINEFAFGRCYNMKEIKVNENNQTYCDIDGALYSKDKTEILKYPIGVENTKYKVLDSVVKIGRYAFADCKYLTSIELPKGLERIDDAAFFNCVNLKNINMPEGLGCIGWEVFAYCSSLTSINIPDSVYYIGQRAFRDCTGITEITIPSNVGNIGEWVFGFCSNLKQINVSEDNQWYCDVDGVLYSKDKTELICYPPAKEGTEYTILDSVTKIGPYAFCGPKLETIEMPEGLKYIEHSAFYECIYLTEVNVPETVTDIGEYAFYCCINLKDINMPKNIENIGGGIFLASELVYLIEGNTNTIEMTDVIKRALNVGDEGYTYELTNDIYTIKGTTIKLHEGKTSAIIQGYGTLEVIISHNTWDISKNGDGSVIATLSNEGKLSITGSGEIKDFESWADLPWYDIKQRIINVEIEEGITNIGSTMFYECEYLKSVKLANSIKSIGKKAFFECNELTNINIPINVTNIGDGAFSACDKLISITVDTNNMHYINDEFGVLYTKDFSKLVQCPGAIKEEYTISSNTKEIGVSAFESCNNLVNIVIPNGVVTIGANAFQNVNKLKSIELPDSVTTVGENIFAFCSNLKTVKISKNMTALTHGMFEECMSLRSIEIPENISKIDWRAFYKSECLIDVRVPSKTEIEWGYNVFRYCEAVTISCYSGTTTEAYAKENNIRYKLIDTITSGKGDVDEENKIIRNIDPDTTIRELIEYIESEMDYEVTDKDGEKVPDSENVGTGFLIKMENGKIYIIIIIGDTNGDGFANLQDIFAINKFRLNKSELDDANLKASDVNGDGKVDIKDIFRINKYRLGKSETL